MTSREIRAFSVDANIGGIRTTTVGETTHYCIIVCTHMHQSVANGSLSSVSLSLSIKSNPIQSILVLRGLGAKQNQLTSGFGLLPAVLRCYTYLPTSIEYIRFVTYMNGVLGDVAHKGAPMHASNACTEYDTNERSSTPKRK